MDSELTRKQEIMHYLQERGVVANPKGRLFRTNKGLAYVRTATYSGKNAEFEDQYNFGHLESNKHADFVVLLLREAKKKPFSHAFVFPRATFDDNSSQFSSTKSGDWRGLRQTKDRWYIFYAKEQPKDITEYEERWKLLR